MRKVILVKGLASEGTLKVKIRKAKVLETKDELKAANITNDNGKVCVVPEVDKDGESATAYTLEKEALESVIVVQEQAKIIKLSLYHLIEEDIFDLKKAKDKLKNTVNDYFMALSKKILSDNTITEIVDET